MSAVRTARDVAAATPDPELPLLSIEELGILREVTETDGRVIVTITPTYSGCPALREIAADIEHRLASAGYSAEIRTQLTPPWTSDWITAAGRRTLRRAGIAPPRAAPRSTVLSLGIRRGVPCPRCGSSDTVQTAAFGATACKALFGCRQCHEPFEYVKEI